jgi:hypothetical protein
MLSNGAFDLNRIECSQDEGRCSETLCALHRYNQRGQGTWYPDTLMASREDKHLRERRPRSVNREGDRGKGSIDQLC